MPRRRERGTKSQGRKKIVSFLPDLSGRESITISVIYYSAGVFRRGGRESRALARRSFKNLFLFPAEDKKKAVASIQPVLRLCQPGRRGEGKQGAEEGGRSLSSRWGGEGGRCPHAHCEEEKGEGRKWAEKTLTIFTSARNSARGGRTSVLVPSFNLHNEKKKKKVQGRVRAQTTGRTLSNTEKRREEGVCRNCRAAHALRKGKKEGGRGGQPLETSGGIRFASSMASRGGGGKGEKGERHAISILPFLSRSGKRGEKGHPQRKRGEEEDWEREKSSLLLAGKNGGGLAE